MGFRVRIGGCNETEDSGSKLRVLKFLVSRRGPNYSRARIPIGSVAQAFNRVI